MAAARRVRWPCLIAMAVLTMSACRVDLGERKYDPRDPDQVAIRLFEVAREVDPSNATLHELFGPVDDLVERADLYDALEGLRDAQRPAVTHVEALTDLGAVAIDLSSGLVGGGEARYSLRLGRDNDDEPWTIHWFRGPGVQWPAGQSRRDSGLTNSPPPG